MVSVCTQDGRWGSVRHVLVWPALWWLQENATRSAFSTESLLLGGGLRESSAVLLNVLPDFD